MTVELVLLLAIFVFVTLPALFGSQHGPFKVFQESGPRLAARVEANMTNGREFNVTHGAPNDFVVPTHAPPDGSLK
jgi:hypothetical protein